MQYIPDPGNARRLYWTGHLPDEGLSLLPVSWLRVNRVVLREATDTLNEVSRSVGQAKPQTSRQ
jgi:hypothetical protein